MRKQAWIAVRYLAVLFVASLIISFPHALPLWVWLTLAVVISAAFGARYYRDRRHSQPRL